MLNLIHHRVLPTLDAESRAEFLALYLPRDVEPGAPSWWRGDEDATVTSIAAWTALRGRRG